jgi:uncharacterized membrane protein YczE
MLCFGIGIALMARADLGLGPWAVLHDGIGRHTGLPLGTVDILVGIPILLAWIPLRERPGPGTVLSAFVIGLATNVGLELIARPESIVIRVAAMAAGAGLAGLGSALYLSAALGPGPRDGLMTGLQRRFRWPLAWVRTAIEVSVLMAGAVLGGAVGPGTVVYALMIGPLLALILRRMRATHVLSAG